MGIAAYLQHELALRQARNHSYSLRAFARDLGFDHATVSQWMRGARPVSPGSARQVCERLGLDGERATQAAAFDPFDLALLAAVRGLPEPTVPKVASLTGASADQVNISLNRLTRLGLLTLKGDRWVGRDEDTE